MLRCIWHRCTVNEDNHGTNYSVNGRTKSKRRVTDEFCLLRIHAKMLRERTESHAVAWSTSFNTYPKKKRTTIRTSKKGKKDSSKLNVIFSDFFFYLFFSCLFGMIVDVVYGVRSLSVELVPKSENFQLNRNKTLDFSA